MRHGNACKSRPGDGRGDSRHNFEWNTCFGDRLRFFSASAKHERIPTFQPNDLLPFVRFLDQQRINFILVAPRFARRFADISDFSIVPRPAERLGIRKVIVNDHVRILDALLGTQCYQAGVARAGTNQINLTSLTHAQPGKP